MPDTRPVWLTREQRDALYRDVTLADEVVAAWDAAPADAAEAITNALLLLPKTPEARSAVATAVLRALGYPEAPP